MAKQKNQKLDSVANRVHLAKETPDVVVTIRRAGKMTPERRAEINNWLRRVGTDLVRNAEKYADAYAAKFFIPKKK